MIHIYTGDGKGKTSASCGLALRAAGRGKRVLFVQFMKGISSSGEILSMKKFPTIETKVFGCRGFLKKNASQERKRKDVALTDRAMRFLKKRLDEQRFDVVVLDEINIAMDYGLIGVRTVANFAQKYGQTHEVVLTGRKAPKSIIDLADYVTEMKMVKHPYTKGLRARRGIEF